MQLNRTEHLQNNLSLNLKDVEHIFSSSDAGGKNLYSLYWLYHHHSNSV